jgi:hypothetical protein
MYKRGSQEKFLFMVIFLIEVLRKWHIIFSHDKKQITKMLFSPLCKQIRPVGLLITVVNSMKKKPSFVVGESLF